MNDKIENSSEVPAGADSEFRSELKTLLFVHHRDNDAHTADWVLADFLIACLDGFELAIARSDAAGALAIAAAQVIAASGAES